MHMPLRTFPLKFGVLKIATKMFLRSVFESCFQMVVSLGGNTSHHLIPKDIIIKLQLEVGRAESLQQ